MTQPDISVAIDYAEAQIGKQYSTGSDRFGDDAFDCSGLVIRALAEAGVPFPNGISAEKKWGNSVSLWYWARNVGGLVSVDEAIRTRGAILIRGRWYGYGPLGDVKFSLGDGRQTGAGSRRTGVATTNVRQGFFHDGFIIPGVDYHLAPPPLDAAALEAIARLMRWRDRVTAKPLALNDTGSDVAILNNLLRRRGYKVKDGSKYGRATQVAVHEFKQAYPKKIGNDDGKHFGGPAADALLGLT